MSVEFGDSAEAWSVARGGVRRWMHCHVPDVDALPVERRDELGAWLAGHDVHGPVTTILVTCADGGYRVHTPGVEFDVELADLPVWLQRPEPQPTPPKTTKARK